MSYKKNSKKLEILVEYLIKDFSFQHKKVQACSSKVLLIGYKPKALSFPSNSYNEQTIDLLKKLKINYAFRANDQINLNPYELARVDATYIIEKIMTG